MRGRTTRGGLAVRSVVLAVALSLVPAAGAAAQITASPPNTYVTTDVTIDQGEQVTFTNTDVAEHDVVARDKLPNGKPLFRSELVGFGGTAPVEGTEYLTTGSYGFFCSLHPQMEGTLNVSSGGKPEPRPGTQPSVKLRVLDTRTRRVKRRNSLTVRITPSGAATVRMTARAKGKAFAKGTTKASGAKTARLKLTRHGRRLVRRAQRITVTVTAAAKFADGRTAKKTAKKTLRR